jgi:hypothetical protein
VELIVLRSALLPEASATERADIGRELGHLEILGEMIPATLPRCAADAITARTFEALEPGFSFSYPLVWGTAVDHQTVVLKGDAWVENWVPS